MLAEMVVVVEALRGHDGRWPEARGVYKTAVGSDQGDNVGLRQVVQPVDEEMVDLLGRHQAIELFRRLDAGGVNLLLCLLNDQIDGLHRTRRLPGDDDAEVPDFLPVRLDRIRAQT